MIHNSGVLHQCVRNSFGETERFLAELTRQPGEEKHGQNVLQHALSDLS